MSPRRVSLLAGGGLLVLPLLLNPYLLFVCSLMFINCILALGLNLVLGYAGQFAFAHAIFFGLGAYATALLKLHAAVPFWLGLPAAGVITAAMGVVVGLPALRLSGLYLAMVTLAFAQLGQWVLIHWPSVTFGAGGVKVPPPSFGPSPFRYETNVYFLCLGLAALAILASRNLVRSKVGRAFVAIRDGELAAQALAIGLARYKTLAFALSALYAGLAGGLHSALLRFIAPEGYDLFQMVIQFVMIVIGGLGSITGSVLGAVLLTAVPEVLRAVKGVQEIVFGALLMGGIILLPDGLAGFLRRAPAWREPLHRPPRPDEHP